LNWQNKRRINIIIVGSFQRGNWKPSLTSSDVVIHLQLSEMNFSPLPFRTTEMSSFGGGRDLLWNDHYDILLKLSLNRVLWD
jgi:hypothetical protein